MKTPRHVVPPSALGAPKRPSSSPRTGKRIFPRNCAKLTPVGVGPEASRTSPTTSERARVFSPLPVEREGRARFRGPRLGSLRRRDPRRLPLGRPLRENRDQSSESGLILAQGFLFLTLATQLLRQTRERLLALRLHGFESVVLSRSLAFERRDAVAAGGDRLAQLRFLPQIAAQGFDQLDPRLAEMFEITGVTRELIRVARRQEGGDFAARAMYVMPPQPLGEFALSPADAHLDFVPFRFEHRERLLRRLALIDEPTQFALGTRHGALRLDELVGRARTRFLGAGDFLLQLTNAPLDVLEIGPLLRDFAGLVGLGQDRGRGGERQHPGRDQGSHQRTPSPTRHLEISQAFALPCPATAASAARMVSSSAR